MLNNCIKIGYLLLIMTTIGINIYLCILLTEMHECNRLYQVEFNKQFAIELSTNTLMHRMYFTSPEELKKALDNRAKLLRQAEYVEIEEELNSVK